MVAGLVLVIGYLLAVYIVAFIITFSKNLYRRWWSRPSN
jgi:hypothetical protein